MAYYVNIPITEDAFLDSTNPNNNYGSTSFLKLLRNNYGVYSNAIRADCSKYTGTITEAKLYVYITNKSAYSCYPYVLPFSSSWNESTITWNNMPARGSSVGDSGWTTDGWKSLTITTSVVQGWINNGNNYGLYFYQSNDTGSSTYNTQIASTDYSSSDFHPYIRVCTSNLVKDVGNFYLFFSEAYNNAKKLWRNNKLILPKDLGFSY